MSLFSLILPGIYDKLFGGINKNPNRASASSRFGDRFNAVVAYITGHPGNQKLNWCIIVKIEMKLVVVIDN